jgi:hypothetical protein
MRPGCRDVFKAFLVKNAKYEGVIEIPILDKTNSKPRKVILFSKALKSKDYDCWVLFYEDDGNFERIWNNPKKYLPILKRFKGVICPDFSLYRDMPLVMQLWNIYRSHAIGRWLQDNGVDVIANVRFGDERTYEACCYGVPKNGIIAVGSHGCLRYKEEKEYFIKGLDYVVKRLNPKTIIVYGAAPEGVFGKYKAIGIEILQFDSDYAVNVGRRNA